MRDDGVWQDGGLLFHFPDTNQWVAVFLAFQSQSWHTDDPTGHALPAAGRSSRARGSRTVGPDRRGPGHPTGPAPEHETVTLLNPGRRALDLPAGRSSTGTERRMPLPTVRLPAGDTVRVEVQPPVQLGNRAAPDPARPRPG